MYFDKDGNPIEAPEAPEIDYDKLAKAMVKNQPEPVAPTPPAEPTMTPTPAAEPTLSIAEQMNQVLDSRQETSSNDALEYMFTEQYANMTANAPGFDDFMKGTDDYGNVREENLNKITDVKKRMQTARQLQQSFSEASSNTPGRKPVVNTREQQMATDMQGKYDAIYDKLDKGEYTNLTDFQNEHAALMTEEANMLRG